MSADELISVVRLSYVGNRGLGALEYKPAEDSRLLNASVNIFITEMSAFCEIILQDQRTLDVNISGHDEHQHRHAILFALARLRAVLNQRLSLQSMIQVISCLVKSQLPVGTSII